MDITITTDDGEITVPKEKVKLPEGIDFFETSDRGIPRGYVPRKELENQITAAKEGLVKPDELLTDDGFFKRLATHRGLQLGEDLKPVAQLDEATKQQWHQAWEQEHVSPKVKRIQELEAAIAEKETESLHSRITRQLNQPETKAKPHMLATPTGKTPSFVRDIAEMFQTDSRGERYFVDDDGAKIFASEVPGGDLVKAAVEHVQKRDKNLLWFEDARQTGGSNFSGGKPDSGGKYIKRSEFEKLSPQEQQRIATSGKVEVID